MFLINGDILNQKDYPEQYKFYQEKTAEIRNSGKNSYIFQVYANNPMNVDEHGNKRPVTNRYKCIPVTSNYNDDYGGVFLNDEWTYVESLSACKRTESGSFIPTRKTYQALSTQILSVKDDIDIIFFFKYICQDKQIKEIDYERNNKERAEKEMLVQNFKSLIYSKKSPIHPEMVGERPMRDLAKDIGVGGAETTDIYTLMNNISDYVSASDKNGGSGYKNFIEMASRYEESEDSKTVKIAIERGVLYYDEPIWKLRSKGGTDDFVCASPKGVDDSDGKHVIAFVLKSDDWYSEVKMALESPRAAIPKKLTRPVLMDMIIDLDLGWKKGVLTLKKLEELEEILENKVKPPEK